MRSCVTAPTRADRAEDNKVLALFFGSGRARFDGPGEGASAGSIHAWLSRLHLTPQAHRPVLQIDEASAGGSFQLSLAVADERAALDAPTHLAEVIAKPAWAAHRLTVLKTVTMPAECHPPLNDYVRTGARRPLAVRPEELPPLLALFIAQAPLASTTPQTAAPMATTSKAVNASPSHIQPPSANHGRQRTERGGLSCTQTRNGHRMGSQPEHARQQTLPWRVPREIGPQQRHQADVLPLH